MIKAIGLENIINIINGTTYGAMKYNCNDNEISNLETMFLYNGRYIAIRENPPIRYKWDIITRQDLARI